MTTARRTDLENNKPKVNGWRAVVQSPRDFIASQAFLPENKRFHPTPDDRRVFSFMHFEGGKITKIDFRHAFQSYADRPLEEIKKVLRTRIETLQAKLEACDKPLLEEATRRILSVAKSQGGRIEKRSKEKRFIRIS